VSFLAAAREILREAKEPMTSKELIAQAIKRGLVSSNGRTPDATMAARLYTFVLRNPAADIRKLSKKKKGNQRAKRGSVRWEYVERPARRVGR